MRDRVERLRRRASAAARGGDRNAAAVGRTRGGVTEAEHRIRVRY